MVQSKISSFFKTHHDPPLISDQIDGEGEFFEENHIDPEILVTYKHRHPNFNSTSGDTVAQHNNNETKKVNKSTTKASSGSNSLSKVSNKKRSYTQFHLELGQSDFLLHTCTVCGLMYSQGDEGDEKVHKAFHRDYYLGIQFKGWRNERVVSKCISSGDRIVLVLDGDPPTQKYKVQQVVKTMEKELGFCDGKLLHELCQVYLFISNQRVVGCLISEPIKTAHRVITDSDDNCKAEDTVKEAKRPCQASLQFGSVVFQREVVRKESFERRLKLDQWDDRAILCEEEAMPAVCGIRAIWVAPSWRQNQVATKLLDATRKSFKTSHELELSQCAFSSPTSAGKAFASRYSGSKSFLIYRAQDV